MIQIGVVGGAGYTAGELIRLLLHHKKVSIDFVYSTSNSGNNISSIHQDLIGETSMRFTDKVNNKVDVLFLCLGHGNSKAFLEKYSFSITTKIIDLSNDFRLNKNANFQNKTFVYGLPELNKEVIKTSSFIANPGCFATAIQLAILPLAKNKMLKNDIHVNAVTGATGAGTSLSATTHYTWRDNNFSYYKPFSHQHLGEINQTVLQLQHSFSDGICFMPYRGNFSRGIFATAYTNFEGTLEKAKEMFHDYYKDAIFTHISEGDLHLKQVVNTNKCLIHLHKHKKKLLITSIIDNLVKGASGQAVHNMNLMSGFTEDEGLQLKATYF